jgi:hypothetical protein
VTQPEHARQSVRDIWAGGRSEEGRSVLKLTSNESYNIVRARTLGSEKWRVHFQKQASQPGGFPRV